LPCSCSCSCCPSTDPDPAASTASAVPVAPPSLWPAPSSAPVAGEANRKRGGGALSQQTRCEGEELQHTQGGKGQCNTGNHQGALHSKGLTHTDDRVCTCVNRSRLLHIALALAPMARPFCPLHRCLRCCTSAVPGTLRVSHAGSGLIHGASVHTGGSLGLPSAQHKGCRGRPSENRRVRGWGVCAWDGGGGGEGVLLERGRCGGKVESIWVEVIGS
jgi:hypothetical protein